MINLLLNILTYINKKNMMYVSKMCYDVYYHASNMCYDVCYHLVKLY